MKQTTGSLKSSLKGQVLNLHMFYLLSSVAHCGHFVQHDVINIGDQCDIQQNGQMVQDLLAIL